MKQTGYSKDLDCAYKNSNCYKIRYNNATKILPQVVNILTWKSKNITRKDKVFDPPFTLTYYRIKDAESLKEKLKRKAGRRKTDQDRYYKEKLTDIIGITFITIDYKRLLQVFETITRHALSDRVHAFKHATTNQVKSLELTSSLVIGEQNLELTDIKIHEIKVYINDKNVYKSKNSLLQKIYEQHKNKKITNPLLMGLLEMYRRNFSKRKMESVLAKIKIESKPNAYEGIHIILKAKFKITDLNSENSNRLQFAEYVEIQCRTFAQSIWYLHEHKNNYKKNKSKTKKRTSEMQYHLLGTVTQLIDQILSIIFSKK